MSIVYGELWQQAIQDLKLMRLMVDQPITYFYDHKNFQYIVDRSLVRQECSPDENIIPLNVGDVLEAAANRIEKFGWTQREYGSRYVGYCILGAIQHEIGYWRDLANAAEDYLVQYMDKHGYFDEIYREMPGSEMCKIFIAVWNDMEGRDKFEVIELLRQAAKEWRNEHAR